MDGHEITELNLSSLERTMRIDAEFYKKEHIAVDKVLSSWNKKSIADCFYVSDGNHMSISDSFAKLEFLIIEAKIFITYLLKMLLH